MPGGVVATVLTIALAPSRWVSFLPVLPPLLGLITATISLVPTLVAMLGGAFTTASSWPLMGP